MIHGKGPQLRWLLPGSSFGRWSVGVDVYLEEKFTVRFETHSSFQASTAFFPKSLP